jgi:hypothetical protein
MDDDMFFVPKNIGDIIANVENGIMTFGVTQIIKEILQETGTLYHLEGKDAKEDTHFDRLDEESIMSSGVLKTVIGAIDPETATLDLNSLSSNLSSLLSKNVSVDDSLSSSAKSTSVSHPQEIVVPSDTNIISERRSEDEIQFLQNVDNIDEIIDLTTFDGLSKFMRTVRIFSDIGPGRGAPVTPKVDQLSREEIPPTPPPPPRLPVVPPVNTSRTKPQVAIFPTQLLSTAGSGDKTSIAAAREAIAKFRGAGVKTFIK